MSDCRILVLEDAEAVARAAAERIVARVQDAPADRGRCALALSGGSTPRALYRLLARDPYRARVAWDRVELFWGDERCVPPSDPESNYRMAKESLLDAVAVPPARVHRIPAGTGEPAAVARAYEAELARVLGGTPGGPPPRLDLVLLGMGADGHTASLFPRSPALAESVRWVVATAAPVGVPERITLTWPILNRAAHVLVLVAGPDKAGTLRDVLEGPRDPGRLPAQGIQPAAGTVEWLVDRAAAARLSAAETSA